MYKTKTGNIRTKNLPVIFLPKLDLNTDLIMTGNLARINSKQTKAIKIPIYNPTNKDIKFQRQIITGQLELISVAVPLEIKVSKLPEVNKIKIWEDSPKWLPNVDLNLLPKNQRVRVQKEKRKIY